MLKKLLIGTIAISMIGVGSLNVASANEDFNQKAIFLKAKQLIDITYDKGYVGEQSSTSITRYFVSILGDKTEILKTNVETKEGLLLGDKFIQPLDTDKKITLNYGVNGNINKLVDNYFALYKRYRDLINKLVNKRLNKVELKIIKKTYLEYKKGEITQAEKNAVKEKWNFMVNDFSTEYAKYIAFKKLIKTSNPIKYHLTYFNIDGYNCQAKTEVLSYNGKKYCNYTYEKNILILETRKQAVAKVKDFIKWMKNELRK